PQSASDLLERFSNSGKDLLRSLSITACNSGREYELKSPERNSPYIQCALLSTIAARKRPYIPSNAALVSLIDVQCPYSGEASTDGASNCLLHEEMVRLSKVNTTRL